MARGLQRYAPVLTDDVSERPRERLLEHGAQVLTTGELLGVILGAGVTGKTAAELGAHLLEHAGGLVTLSRADARELATIHGIGIARATRLVAAFQLGRRAVAEPPRDLVVRNADDIYRYLEPRLRGLMQEVFVVVALDARNAIIQHVEIARGSLTTVEVHPREVFRPLVRLAAAAAVVAHNHPSGDPTPSEFDVALTRRLRRAGDLLGIPVLEHLVIGAEGHASIGELVGAEDADWEGEW